VDKRLSRLVDLYLDSYSQCGGINHIDGVNLPSKSAVGEMTLDLLELLFPGFRATRPLRSESLPEVTHERLASIELRMREEIGKSLEYRPAEGKVAGEIVMHFLEALVETRCVLQTDVEAALRGDPACVSNDEVIVAYPGLEAIAVYRMAHLLYREGVPLIPRMMTEWAHSRTGIDIHPGAKIGTHFFIDHGTGVVIGETSEIGNHVRIYQGVGLVGRSIEENVARDTHGKALVGKRHPTIQDHVTIYAGATILGGDTVIGERSIIGGNVWVVRSVPPDSVVVYELSGNNIRTRNRHVPDWQI
jgi:serine O-acetyltransferase